MTRADGWNWYEESDEPAGIVRFFAQREGGERTLVGTLPIADVRAARAATIGTPADRMLSAPFFILVWDRIVRPFLLSDEKEPRT